MLLIQLDAADARIAPADHSLRRLLAPVTSLT
jgi:hypothetical protein